MRHLESLMGEEVFRDGLREYLKTYSFGNATWSDLIGFSMRGRPPICVKWSHVWVEEARRPEIYTTLDVMDGKISRLSFEQRDPARGNRQWPQELRLLIGYRDKTVPLKVSISRRDRRCAGCGGHAGAALRAAQRRRMGIRRLPSRSRRRSITSRTRCRSCPTR